jgi:hypothetical protein
MPGCLIKCTAPLVADYIERACSIAATSQPAGSNSIVTLQPQNPQRPADGLLQVVRRSHQQQEQQQTAGSSTAGCVGSSSGKGGFLPGDHVPHTLLPLLQHMFVEQVPIIISTLKLLRQWSAQQQQQQRSASAQQQVQQQRQLTQEQRQQQSRTSRPKVQPPPGWLLLPRSLGMHSCQLYDPATGAVTCAGSKASSSYVTWRAAEIVGWYKGLDVQGRAAVQQLLTDISVAGEAAAEAAGDHRSSEAGRAAANDSSCRSAAGVTASSLAGHHSASPAAAVGAVDAVAAFDEVVRLVEQCGQLARISNRIMLKPAVAGLGCRQAAAPAASGIADARLASRL